jgi:drug/metabolite transporter (DMT)-like permease
MAAVLIGVVLVARSAGQFERAGSLSQADIRRSVTVALTAAAAVALGVGTAQEATPTFGQLQTVWLGRIMSLIVLIVLFAAQRRLPHLPPAWWPLVALQGLLDSGAYVAVLFGGHGPGSEIAVVVASSFSVVTVILARVILKESMSGPQWACVVAIVFGIGTLTTTGK